MYSIKTNTNSINLRKEPMYEKYKLQLHCIESFQRDSCLEVPEENYY